ncbi:hypothetical protein BW730_12650 [Tessaracoccus aquimaris]|uniref:Uncharacterized protein n=1 Tax=Tessaracoccus aquimaris TaxID=1332264 RepID=A0A1Q2CQ28_9ACTN|nr:hypothetical protein [Tessaracoccus aquimaris]AQP48228.1 hypothetical protein BW730_12650 [Tessaracoccus aquimaris]
MDLDDLLDASSPGIAPRDEALHTELLTMTLATRDADRLRGRRFRVGLVGLVSAALVAGGVATAGAVMNGWFGFGTTTDTACVADITFSPKGNEGEGSETYPRDVEDAAVAASEAFLKSYNFDAIDADAAAKRQRQVERQIIDGQEEGERQPVLSDQQNELNGITQVFIDDWKAHLTELGLPWRASLLSVGWTCES